MVYTFENININIENIPEKKWRGGQKRRQSWKEMGLCDVGRTWPTPASSEGGGKGPWVTERSL